MKLTAFTDYSLRVLIYLAAEPGRRATIAEISAAFDISENHLTKVIHFLGRCGWLSTLRGKGGGVVLAKPAEDINVGLVVRDTEGMIRPAECFSEGGSRCAIAPCCRLKNVLGQAVQAFYAVLDNHSLDQIARNQRELAGLLHFHRPAPPGLAP